MIFPRFPGQPPINDGTVSKPWRDWFSAVVEWLRGLQWENQITVSGTSYTVDATVVPSGAVLRFTSGSAVTVTLSSNLPTGWCCSWRQIGAGQVTFTGVRHGHSHTKSYGQYAWGALAKDGDGYVYLGGDTA